MDSLRGIYLHFPRSMYKCIIILFIPLFGACSFGALEEDLKVLNASTEMNGKVLYQQKTSRPILVVLYEKKNGKADIAGYTFQRVPEEFTFTRDQGIYYIAAFEDANHDFIYQPGEAAGYYGKIKPINTAASPAKINFELRLDPTGKTILSERPNLTVSKTATLDYTKQLYSGKIISLDDPRFSEENAQLGLWQPVKFIDNVGVGLSFLEPYDSKKIPVIFIHGMTGTPQNWRYIIKGLDRRKYQPWLIYYPSGLSLNQVVEGLSRALNEAYVRYQPKQAALIAHSMGGLVARGIINKVTRSTDANIKFPNVFITIATPWHGHSSALSGVKYAPAVVPAWIDMVPGSPYQAALFKRPLPQDVHHYLFFAFKNDSTFSTESADGVISLESQLYPPAQQHAVLRYGFNETHTSVLKSAEVVNKITRILNNNFLIPAKRK